MGGLSLQMLEARPSERLRPGHGGGSSRPYPLDPVVRDKGPGPSALQKRFSTKTESSEASKAFIKGEMVQDTGILRERVRVAPSWQFELLFGVLIPGFLWPIILIYLAHSLYLVYLWIPPCVRMYLSAKVDFTEKASG